MQVFVRGAWLLRGLNTAGYSSGCSEWNAPSPLLSPPGEDAPLSSGSPAPERGYRRNPGLRLQQDFRFTAAAGSMNDSSVQLSGSLRTFPELSSCSPGHGLVTSQPPAKITLRTQRNARRQTLLGRDFRGLRSSRPARLPSPETLTP
ncbi:hypothetical protein P7K49_030230 [Saguinus oedipus]|uniref:Uncharacterized protein n=1 Tax=Saguinus oedipus TaxID=9490 RepID=A0ABQ9U1L8_SAGOE|nr:hypothetical protein P7K49_030230 [Saguinus oedipus]